MFGKSVRCFTDLRLTQYLQLLDSLMGSLSNPWRVDCNITVVESYM